MFLRGTLVLLVLALLAPSASSESSGAYAPRHVSVLAWDPSGSAVSWIPGEEAADSFRVYGFTSGGTRELLLDTAETPTPLAPFAVVQGGYLAYGVSGVAGGAETRVVLAGPCYYVQTNPPGIGEGDCPKTRADAAYRLA